jgi:hypothetical protein
MTPRGSTLTAKSAGRSVQQGYDGMIIDGLSGINEEHLTL